MLKIDPTFERPRAGLGQCRPGHVEAFCRPPPSARPTCGGPQIKTFQHSESIHKLIHFIYRLNGLRTTQISRIFSARTIFDRHRENRWVLSIKKEGFRLQWANNQRSQSEFHKLPSKSFHHGGRKEALLWLIRAHGREPRLRSSVTPPFPFLHPPPPLPRSIAVFTLSE